MTKTNPYFASFNVGEVTPRLAARTDFSKYPEALETCVNLIPLAEGGVMRRPCTRYVTEIVDSTVKGRLEKFQFSTTQAYVLELGANIMRFYRHQGQIVAGATTGSVTNGTFTSDISGWTDQSVGSGSIVHDATNGRMTLAPGGTATTDVGWAEQQITNSSAIEYVVKFRVIGPPGDRLSLQIGTTTTGSEIVANKEFAVGYHAYAFTATAADFYLQFAVQGSKLAKSVQLDDVSLISSGAAITLDTPWPEADLFELNSTQSADVLYMFHEDYPTHKLIRHSHTSWSLVEVAWTDGPYLDENTTDTTITPAADSGLGVNFTLSSVTGVNGDAGWKSTDVGRSIRYKRGRNGPWGWGVISAVTNTTVAVVDIKNDDEIPQVWQVDASPSAYVDMTDAANSLNTNADLVPFPTTEASTDYIAIGHTFPFNHLTFNNANGTQGSGGTTTVAWQYWNGSSWAALSNVTDNTTSFKAAKSDGQTVFWTLPGDWAKKTESSSESLYFMRGILNNAYTINPVYDSVTLRVQSTASAVTEWRLGAWSGTTGYPSTGVFYEQRLYSANSTNQPQTIWASQTADFENMTPDDLDDTVEDDDGLSYTISASEVNAIRWMSPGEDTLAIGTTGGEWVPDSAGIVLTPNDIVIRRRTKHGSANVQPVRVGNAVLFVQSAKRKLREFGFAFEVDGFRAVDMTRLAQHVTLGGLVELDYQQEPHSLVWAVRNDGQLLSMTYRREEDVVAWARHVIGGNFSGGDAVVDSVTVISGADGAGQTQSSEDRDEVWVIVKRTINGSTKRYIEVFEGDYEDGDAIEDSYYADSIITYDSSAATTISGLDHLEAETVAILADGYVHPSKVVTGGAVTLNDSASTVQVGLPYTHTLKTLRMEGVAAGGTAVGKTKKITAITFVLLNSHMLSYGPSTSTLKTIDFREVSDAMGTAVPLFTGERREVWDDNWKSDPRIVVQSSSPTPFTLLAMAPEVDTKEFK